MIVTANPARGETVLSVDGVDYLLRPTFEALVAAEEELGSLFALVEAASEGELLISQIAGLLWHCIPQENRPDRARVGAAILDVGLVEAAKPLRLVLSQIVKGSG